MKFSTQFSTLASGSIFVSSTHRSATSRIGSVTESTLYRHDRPNWCKGLIFYPAVHDTAPRQSILRRFDDNRC